MRQTFHLNSGASSLGRVKESSSLLVTAVELLCRNDGW